MLRGGLGLRPPCSRFNSAQPVTFGSRRTCLVVHAAKGFGKTKQSNKDDVRGGGPGVKRVNVRPPPQLPGGMGQAAAVQQFDDLEAAKKRAGEEAEFQARLDLIKAEAAQKKAAAPAAAAASSSNSAPARAVFDAPPPEEDIYSNPPSLLSTLQDQLQSDINDPALRQAKIGPGQLGLAGGAVLFGLVFVLVSGGDFATTNRYKGLRTAQPSPDPVEMARLSRQAESFEDKYDANPADLESLEAAAVTYARMQDFRHASDLLDKLTAAHPEDAEAWRLLGEARLLDADPSRSVAAYEKAIALAPLDQQIVTGLVDSYVANSQQAKAISYLTGLRDRLMAAAVDTPSSSSSSSSAAGSGAEAGDATGSSSSEQQPAESSSGSRPDVDVIQVQLLLGKSYAAWRGHDQDALAAYDTLVGAFPTDFRGYLAKAVFLRERGRQGDAERMFLQAKLYAPESMQAFIAARAGERPDVGMLPDNGLE